MGASRLRGLCASAFALVSCLALAGTLAAACGSTEEPAPAAPAATEPPPLPNPPPRYAHAASASDDAGPALPDGSVIVRCGGRTPYVCARADGSFECSEWPCVPDCSRIGCVGGDVCKPCEAGMRCVAAGDDC